MKKKKSILVDCVIRLVMYEQGKRKREHLMLRWYILTFDCTYEPFSPQAIQIKASV